jgi:GNAT superfamily N-acetyltransferase
LQRLISSRDLVRRASEAASAYTLARLRILARIPGNPIGADFRISDNVVALMARGLPSPAFNSVTGLRDGQADRIGPLVAWYREQGAAGRFEISSADSGPALGRELARLGFFQSGFHAAFVGEADRAAAGPREEAIERVTSPAQMEDFLSAYVAGWAIPEAARAQFKQNVRPWLGEPDWRLYLARSEGAPAAAAILFLHEGVGYLADCAVDPALRGRGFHQALVRRRKAEAADAGVDFVCSGADFLSTSHRNMERAGMRLLFLRAIWTPLD